MTMLSRSVFTTLLVPRVFKVFDICLFFTYVLVVCAFFDAKIALFDLTFHYHLHFEHSNYSAEISRLTASGRKGEIPKILRPMCARHAELCEKFQGAKSAFHMHRKSYYDEQ